MSGPEQDTEDEGQRRRRHIRVELPLLVQYRFGALDEPQFDYALNVSQSGLFIAMESSEHEVGTRVYVQVTTRDGAHFLQGEGTVVRTSGGGCAVELDGFSDQDRGILEGYVQKALEEQRALGVGPATRRDERGS